LNSIAQDLLIEPDWALVNAGTQVEDPWPCETPELRHKHETVIILAGITLTIEVVIRLVGVGNQDAEVLTIFNTITVPIVTGDAFAVLVRIALVWVGHGGAIIQRWKDTIVIDVLLYDDIIEGGGSFS